MDIVSVAVFCGSQLGGDPVFADHARQLGALIAGFKMKLIYGGGKRGLMGVVADAVLKNNGEVLGIIPEFLREGEQQHETLTELAVVTDMHSRKKMLYERSDIAIILPGGFGTLDELFEMLTWNQLKLHEKKIFLLNSGNFYEHLIKHLRQMQNEGFLYDKVSERIIICDTPDDIFFRLTNDLTAHTGDEGKNQSPL
jgi:uncharacterized protein (TIGR00730 family)